MYWLEVSVVTDGEGAEAVAEALRPYAHDGGVVLEQLGDETDLDPNALETAVTVKIYLSEENDTPELRRRLQEVLYHLGRLYPLPPPTFRELAEQDWANAWKVNYHPFRIGDRIWIQPSWIEVAAAVAGQDSVRPDDIVLTLDPGMAFGTGLHPTTQMCLLALEKMALSGRTLLDVGTGSAILSIAAAKLGASSLLGIDTDELAVKAAAANAAQNGVADCIAIRQGTLDTVGQLDVGRRQWDVVVVNILAPVIIRLLEHDGLMGYVGENGRLILSGILAEQAGGVETAVVAAGGQIIETLSMGDWIAYIIQAK